MGARTYTTQATKLTKAMSPTNPPTVPPAIAPAGDPERDEPLFGEPGELFVPAGPEPVVAATGCEVAMVVYKMIVEPPCRAVPIADVTLSTVTEIGVGGVGLVGDDNEDDEAVTGEVVGRADGPLPPTGRGSDCDDVLGNASDEVVEGQGAYSVRVGMTSVSTSVIKSGTVNVLTWSARSSGKSSYAML